MSEKYLDLRVTPERMREARMASGLTMTQLARAVGTSKQCIVNWELGAVEPRISTLIKFAAATGVHPVWLMGGHATVQFDRHGRPYVNATRKAV